MFLVSSTLEDVLEKNPEGDSTRYTEGSEEDRDEELTSATLSEFDLLVSFGKHLVVDSNLVYSTSLDEYILALLFGRKLQTAEGRR